MVDFDELDGIGSFRVGIVVRLVVLEILLIMANCAVDGASVVLVVLGTIVVTTESVAGRCKCGKTTNLLWKLSSFLVKLCSIKIWRFRSSIFGDESGKTGGFVVVVVVVVVTLVAAFNASGIIILVLSEMSGWLEFFF